MSDGGGGDDDENCKRKFITAIIFLVMNETLTGPKITMINETMTGPVRVRRALAHAPSVDARANARAPTARLSPQHAVSPDSALWPNAALSARELLFMVPPAHLPQAHARAARIPRRPASPDPPHRRDEHPPPPPSPPRSPPLSKGDPKESESAAPLGPVDRPPPAGPARSH